MAGRKGSCRKGAVPKNGKAGDSKPVKRGNGRGRK